MTRLTRMAAVLAATALPAFAAHAADALSTDGELLDRIVAVVNDGVVLESELDAQLRAIEARFRSEGNQLPPREVLRRQLLERLVVVRAQLQRAEQIGLTVPDEQLNEALSGVAQRNGITLGQLPAALAAQGIDYALYREEMRREILLDQLRARIVGSRIEITPGEVERHMNREAKVGDDIEYAISHILIQLPSAPSPEAIAEAADKAELIRQRVAAGEDFSQLAVAYSAGQTALEGGRLGWRRASQLPTMIAEKIPEMQVGDVTEPIRGGGGLHLFRLDDSRGAEKVIVQQRLARHILIRPSEVLTDVEARMKLERLREQIVSGEETFETLARAESDDKSSANEGGELGWAAPGTFVPEFEKTLDGLSPGELSGVFRSQFGWHLVELLDTREHDSTEDINRNKAFAAIRARKFEEETQRWLRELRDESFVDVRL